MYFLVGDRCKDEQKDNFKPSLLRNITKIHDEKLLGKMLTVSLKFSKSKTVERF